MSCLTPPVGRRCHGHDSMHSSNQSTEFVFDGSRYAKLAARSASGYARASPFPHIVIDKFLLDDVVESLVGEFPKHRKINWHNDKRHTEINPVCGDETRIGPLTRRLFYQFHSFPFLRFLEKVTSIDKLSQDPALRGGGLHQVRRGGACSSSTSISTSTMPPFWIDE